MPEEPQAEHKKPMIRTMKSDVDELFKDERPTIGDIMGQELRERPKTISAHRRSITKYIFSGLAVAVVLLFGMVGVIYYLNTVPAQAPVHQLIPPKPFFLTEDSRSISVPARNPGAFSTAIKGLINESQKTGTMKSILVQVQDGPTEHFATLGDFLQLAGISTTPAQLLQLADSPVMGFLYAGADTLRLGFVVTMTDKNRTLGNMLLWEPSIPGSASGLFPNESVSIPANQRPAFVDETYRNIDFRSLPLSQTKDIGIFYAVFPARNYLILTTSKESLQKTIDRLFDVNL